MAYRQCPSQVQLMTSLFIRVDGNPTIGYGHIMRCLSLAEMVRARFAVKFYSLNPSEAIKQIIRENNFELVAITSEDQFFHSLTGNEIVVLDGYQFDTNYQRSIKGMGNKLVCIDDLHDKEFLADVIVNHAPGVSSEFYKTSRDTVFLLGPKYALLRPAFLLAARESESERTIGPVDDVLICFGGSDPRNLTLSVLKQVLTFDLSRIILVTGSGYKYFDLLERAIASNERVTHIRNANGRDMANAFRSADLAIVPASGILFEAIASRLAIISGFYVENQIGIYNGFKRLGTFIDAAEFNDNDLRLAIASALQLSFAQMISNQRQALDGKSGERFLKLFTELCR